jgi:hypothetical protein
MTAAMDTFAKSPSDTRDIHNDEDFRRARVESIVLKVESLKETMENSIYDLFRIFA